MEYTDGCGGAGYRIAGAATVASHRITSQTDTSHYLAKRHIMCDWKRRHGHRGDVGVAGCGLGGLHRVLCDGRERKRRNLELEWAVGLGAVYHTV